MKDTNPIDELFKKQLSKHELEPSAAVWSKIAASQKAGSNKVGGFYFLRAAVITLLIGLSSLLYFQQNQAVLMNPLPEEGIELSGVAKGANAGAENKKNNGKAAPEEVKKEQGKSNEEPSKKPLKKAVPILSAPVSSPILVQNNLKLVDEQALIDELENNDVSLLAYEEIDASKVQKKPRYSISVKLPVVETYYGPDTTQPARERFSKKLWSYASDQFERVLAGDKPQWPKTDKEPELAFNVPKIFK